MIWIIGIAAVYLGSILFIRFRNDANFDLKRQLSDFSTFMVPFNIPAYFLSKVPNTPLVATSEFPELAVIEENWETIREEALQLYENGHIAIKEDDLPGSSFYKDNRWTSFYLKIYDNEIPSAYKMAPKTMALIERVPSMRMALFACLNPGKKLNNHHDPFAFTLRYSMGLSTPNSEESGLYVNGRNYPWYDGKSILFDETYFHSAHNNTEVPRIILMTDIDRPLKSSLIQKGYYYFGRFFNGVFSVDNFDSEFTGWGNKLGKYLNAYKAFLKRFKRWNKTFYTVTKLVTIAFLLFGLASLFL